MRSAIGMYLLQLPTNTLIGDFISYSNSEMNKVDGDKLKFTFAGSVYFNRMKELGLYTIDSDVVKERVKKTGLENIFDKVIVK